MSLLKTFIGKFRPKAMASGQSRSAVAQAKQSAPSRFNAGAPSRTKHYANPHKGIRGAFSSRNKTIPSGYLS